MMTGFHHLPQEVRNLIYQFALIDPPRWNKKHTIDCIFKPTNTQDPEEPPFIQTQVRIDEKNGLLKTSTPCSCARRQGLSLLRTCKAINEAASPIFWSQNTFCFLDAAEFITSVRHHLRPWIYQRIRDISIMNPEPLWRRAHANAALTRSDYMGIFWETLRQCKKLERLEIPTSYIESNDRLDTPKCLNRLTDALPALSTLRLNFLLPLSPYSDINGCQPPTGFGSDHNVVYAGFSHPISLQDHGKWLPETVKELHRNLQSNFRVHTETAIKTQFYSADIGKHTNHQQFFKLSPSLNEFSTSRAVTLPSGTTTTIEFYGLPITAQTKRARWRSAVSQLRRERGEGISIAEMESYLNERRRERRKKHHDYDGDGSDEMLGEQLSNQLSLENREVRSVRERGPVTKSTTGGKMIPA